VKLSRKGAWAIIVIAAVIAMGLSLWNGFVYDDLPAIVNNTRVTDPSRWSSIPRAPYWLGTLWRPFTVMMYALQWRAAGGAPWFFHFVSLVVYAGIGVVLFSLLERLGASRPFALIAAVLFAVHPVHVEAVANVVGQAELWTALWLMLATMVYIRARELHTESRSLPALLVFVTLGIVSKEQGFVAPLLLAAAEWILFAGRGEPLKARVRMLWPATAIAVLMFVLRGMLLNSNIGETPSIALHGLNPLGRFVTMLAVIPEWARLILVPLHLQADYGPPGIPVGGPIGPRHVLGLLLLIGFVVLFVRTRFRNPAIAFGLAWVAIALAPVSNLLTPTGIVMAERVLFIPTIGFAIVIATMARPGLSAAEGSAKIRGPVSHRMTLALATIVAIAFAVRSATRVPTWRTQDRFFSDITLDGAEAYRGWKVAAEYWDASGDRRRAIALLQHSIALWPHDYEVFERLGQIHRQDGRCADAIPLFALGVAEAPDQATVRAKLVECLLTEKQFDEAQRVADEGVARGLDEFKPMQVRVLRVRGDSVRE
jgi:hypothetical protein